MGGNRLVEHDTFLDVMEMLGGLRPASTWSWSALDEYSILHKPQLDLVFKTRLFNEGLWEADAAGISNLNNLGLHGFHRVALSKVITL